MLENEWLEIGYSKGLIERVVENDMTFSQAYRMWLVSKIKSVKPQSVDRIDVAYNRYILGKEFSNKLMSTIAEKDIIELIANSVHHGELRTRRDLDRLFQIVKGVIVYSRDTDIAKVKLMDWESVRRNIPWAKLENGKRQEYAVSPSDVKHIIDLVVYERIYPLKQSACLCICLNFYLGLRIGELAGLKFKDFDLRNNLVHISRTETKYFERDEEGEIVGSMQYTVADSLKTINAYRTIPLVREARYLFLEIRKHHEQMGYKSEYLAYDGTETVLVRSIDRTLRRLCKLCDVRYFNSHAIRKSFATILHHDNVPTKVISGLMGHSEMSTTERCYILSYDEECNHALEYMSDSLKYE